MLPRFHYKTKSYYKQNHSIISGMNKHEWFWLTCRPKAIRPLAYYAATRAGQQGWFKHCMQGRENLIEYYSAARKSQSAFLPTVPGCKARFAISLQGSRRQQRPSPRIGAPRARGRAWWRDHRWAAHAPADGGSEEAPSYQGASWRGNYF